MIKISGEQLETLTAQEIKTRKEVTICGMVHKVRDMKSFVFIVVRRASEVIQCVMSKDNSTYVDLKEESSVKIIGNVILTDKVEAGFEIDVTNLEVLSSAYELSPVTINKKDLNVNLDVNLDNRVVSLRNEKQRAIFKIQEGIVRGFKQTLHDNGFTEIRTPKIVANSAEGGANVFKFDYFGREVALAQSPQFYKQMMVSVFEKVYEVAPVFRAEKHNTSRHLNEYISMDLEMGFIESFYDIMNLETKVLKNIFALLKKEYEKEVKLLNIDLPVINEIPAVKFTEAKEILEKELGRKTLDKHDLEPEEEQLLSKYAKDKYDSDFIFITHYPSYKRPFYTLDDVEDENYTCSFDLLFRGVEITTGGQRIHDYEMQVNKMKKKGLNPEDFKSYLKLHKHGVAPHGGLGLGLERLTAKIIELSNVKEASLFPRDITRVD